MNVFLQQDIADSYDHYYQTEFGKKVDKIEKEIIASFLHTIPKEEILDVGCGTGHWTDFFARKGFRVTGVDSSARMIDIAKHKKINARFLLADAGHLPFENEYFPVLTSITMLEFVEHQEESILEMYRVLKKGGLLIIGLLNADSIVGINRGNDEVFKHAKMFSIPDLTSKFSPFRLLNMQQGVYLNEKYEIIEPSKRLHNIEPVFIGLLLQKIL